MSHLIEVKNINKFYNAGENKVQVLNDISLDIEEGKMYSIVGPSGSGKSTFLNVKIIQETAAVTDTKPLQDKIDKISEKKHKSVDLMLEGIILKDDLKVQIDQYDSEIAELTEQITNNGDIDHFHKKQLEEIRKYIEQINQTENIDTNSFEVYNSMHRKIVVYDDSTIDYFLTCIPVAIHAKCKKMTRKIQKIIL